MDQKLLNARSRTESGKGFSKRLRSEGRLPAVMYDGEAKAVMLDINELEFSKLHHLITESTLVMLDVDGKKKVEVFVKDTQYDIISNRITHVDFYEVAQGKTLRAKILIKLSGSPIGVRMGGVLEAGITEVEVECLPKDLPPRIVVDVTDLELNHSVHVKDLKFAAGVKVLSDKEQTVAALHYVKAEIPAAGEAAPAAAPAAAVAAPAK